MFAIMSFRKPTRKCIEVNNIVEAALHKSKIRCIGIYGLREEEILIMKAD